MKTPSLLSRQTDAIIKAAQACGFGLYRSRALALLAMKKTATSRDLWLGMKMPRSRCYDVLDSLVSDGFAIREEGKKRQTARGRPGMVYRLAPLKSWVDWAAARERKLHLSQNRLLSYIGVLGGKKLL